MRKGRMKYALFLNTLNQYSMPPFNIEVIMKSLINDRNYKSRNVKNLHEAH